MKDADLHEVCLVISILIMAFLIGLIIGTSAVKRDYREKTIKAGAAKWVLIDEYGNTEFKWNTEDAK